MATALDMVTTASDMEESTQLLLDSVVDTGLYHLATVMVMAMVMVMVIMVIAASLLIMHWMVVMVDCTEMRLRMEKAHDDVCLVGLVIH